MGDPGVTDRQLTHKAGPMKVCSHQELLSL
jgi:hypothetical protein